MHNRWICGEDLGKRGYGGGNVARWSPPAVEKVTRCADVVGLAPSTCSTSFQDTLAGRQRMADIYVIPSTRESSNGLIKGQQEWSGDGQNSSECQSGLVFLRISPM